MPTVILLRHGRTSANAQGVLAGHARGVLLDETGREQAARAGDRLSQIRLAAIVSSPLERTRETANAVAKANRYSTKVTADKSFIECDYGDWSMKKLNALAKKPLWQTVQQHPSGVVFPSGESMAAMQHRAVEGIREWNDAVGERGVYLVVSHGDVIKSIIADALGMHLDNFQRISVDPASISVITYTKLRPFVITVNDSGADLAFLRSAPRKRSSDAAVGGGAGRG